MHKSHLALVATVLFAALALLDTASRAQDKAAAGCVVTTTRTACPGKEADSYKKCDGKKSCSKPVEAASAEACAAAATSSCSNDRLEITKSKVITAKFNGKAVKSKSGQDDLCLDYANRATEFDQCTKK